MLNLNVKERIVGCGKKLVQEIGATVAGVVAGSVAYEKTDGSFIATVISSTAAFRITETGLGIATDAVEQLVASPRGEEVPLS